MLFTLVGDDFPRKQKRLKEILAGLREKKPEANFIHWDFLDLDEQKLEESLETIGGLFEEKNIYLFSNIFQKVKIKNLFLDKLEEISKSENAFVLSLDKITSAEEKKLEKNSYIFESFNLVKSEFKIFALSDALQEKNKKELWLKYHQALKSGLVPEQIFANLFYGLKALVLVEKFSEEKSGLKPFPYKKAVAVLKRHWKEKEAEDKLFKLLSTYNQSRLSGLNLENSLEKFILEL